MRLSRQFFTLIMALVLLCSLLPMGTLDASVAAAQPSEEYVRPDMTIAELTTKPRIDGELEAAWKNQATAIVFTEEALEKTGLIWTYSPDNVNYNPLPDVSGTAYVAYDANYFYFALEVNKADHVNDASSSSMLWAGDCLQLQIGPDANLFASDTDPATCTRYEMGFALSTFTQNRRLGYKWYPEPSESLATGAKQDMSKADGDYYYYVRRDDENTKTIYEIALKYSFFGRSEPMEAGDVIPFSFALHINELNPVSDTDSGSSMEWAQGIVGGDIDKNIASAARLTLGGVTDPPIDPDPIDPIDPNTPEYKYAVTEDGKGVEITRYNGAGGDVVIPSTLGGKPVTSIGWGSFSGCETLTSITIPNGVITIIDGAFYDCPALVNVTIPDSVTSIGDSAFSRCTSLTQITIPKSVTKIGKFAFCECSALQSIRLPNGVTEIGVETFYGCTSLASITIPESVTSIAANAFSGCSPFMIIFGKVGSTAETYASENNILFLNSSILGDVNDDGKINTTDARVVLKYAASIIGEDELNVEAADVTFDGKINTTDARVILQVVAFSSSLEFPSL